MIRLEHVNKYYVAGEHRLHVLRDLSIEIERGEFVSIMGSSGSGKSTLLNIMGLLDTPSSGTYSLDGTSTQGLSEARLAGLRNRHLGFVFQSFNLLPFKSALENVALPLYYQRVPRTKRHQIALTYLERMGLKDWADHRPAELSGGQKQRVAIARALVTKPAVVLADEPTGALDSGTSSGIMDILSEVHREGITVVLVTHEADIAARTQRLIRLQDGQIMSASPEQAA